MTDTLCEFALARYRRPGVAECCLHLQDCAGADVNMLLAAAWLAEQHRCWRPAQVRDLIAHCADWRERCLLPLRAARRYLQGHPLYPQAKALELDAEIHQLRTLHAALQTMTLQKGKSSRADILAANLQSYFDCLADPPALTDSACRTLIAALH